MQTSSFYIDCLSVKRTGYLRKTAISERGIIHNNRRKLLKLHVTKTVFFTIKKGIILKNFKKRWVGKNSARVNHQ
jgi:hypothetical protein